MAIPKDAVIAGTKDEGHMKVWSQLRLGSCKGTAGAVQLQEDVCRHPMQPYYTAEIMQANHISTNQVTVSVWSCNETRPSRFGGEVRATVV